ncbi:hypothetical protein [Oribacterium sp. NK2B42]|uniref:hypothetical protein n=1 Tax=Oribacterium sp. NK2B42 TaxID=689781 RepID=UPI0005D2A4FF|nr:hypothetical protein [Oribacterium sp. NK2B42]
MEHHDIDPYTLPRDKQALYINEPWLVDKTLLELPPHEKPEEGKHSSEAVELVREFVKRLEEIPDGCAECFSFETIDEMSREYLENR